MGDHRRKKKDPTLEADLTSLVDQHTGGDPGGKRKLTRKSLRSLAKMLPPRESESGSDTAATAVADSMPHVSSTFAWDTAGAAIADSEPLAPTTLGSDTAGAAIAESKPLAPTTLGSDTAGAAIAGSTPLAATTLGSNTAGAAIADSKPLAPTTLGSDTAGAAVADSTSLAATTLGSDTAGATVADSTSLAVTTLGSDTAHSAPLKPASYTVATVSTDFVPPLTDKLVHDPPEGVNQSDSCKRRASPNTIARLLKKLKYSLRSNIKRLIGNPHPDRDKQYRYIQAVRLRFQRQGQPTASIDAKKSELIGNFKNPGRAYCRKPEPVNTYDFRSDAEYRATAYGIYDTAANHALVVVGISVITGKFAVAAIRRWWREIGSRRYPAAKILMLEADGGGCNGHRLRLWKFELQQFADDTGLSIMVCHYPPGASKWNPIEHRVFSRITANWGGEVLRTLGKMLALIRGTGTETGLVIDAELDDSVYEKGIRISDKEMKALNIHHRRICPQWNYIIQPRNSGSNL